MHINKINSKFVFKKKNISYADWYASLQANPNAGRVRKINPQILCEAGQPDPLFTSQVRGGPMRSGPSRIDTLFKSFDEKGSVLARE